MPVSDTNRRGWVAFELRVGGNGLFSRQSFVTPANLQPPALLPASITLTWSSVSNRTYALEWATGLDAAPVFRVLQSNITGMPDSTIWTDTNNPGSAPCLYRVRVEQ